MRRAIWLLLLLTWPTWGGAGEREQQRPAALSVYEDRSGALGIDDVAALPEQAFRPLPERRFFREYTHSAFWFRVETVGASERDYRRWLSMGDPRLTDIAVYVPTERGWRRMQAGIVYPPEQWAVLARQPLFPMEPQTKGQLLVRVAGDSLIVVEPLFWSEHELLRHRQRIAFADGLTLGIVLLVVPLSLVIGRIMRSRLLVVHAATVLGYILLTCIVNGYLINWPTLLPWTAHLRFLTSVTSFAAVLTYLCVLLQVRQLTRVWVCLYGMAFTLFMLSSMWGLFVDHAVGRQAAEWVMRLTIYLLVPITLLASWRRGLPLMWMAWAVPMLYLLQFLARYVFQADQIPWQSRQDFLSLSSTLPGVAVLACTLVTELYRSRARQRWAQAERGQRRLAARARLEATVARRTDQLDASLHARASLLSRLSRELRGPLLDIIDRARRLYAVSSGDYPQRIERNAQRQLELIEELGALSHQDALPSPSLRAGSLHAFVRELAEEAELLATRKHNRFECRLAAGVPDEVLADFGRLRRVLINLLGNAAKFTRDGRLALSVDCIERDDRRVRLRFCVADTGIGVHPEDRANLQQPFMRGRNVGVVEGFGLGLDIVRQLLNSLDSALHLAEDGLPGSRFSFEVRLLLAERQDVAY